MLGIDAETTSGCCCDRSTCSFPSKQEETSSTDELPQPPASEIRALVVEFDFGGYATSFQVQEFEHNSGSRTAAGLGYMITKSEDSKIRFWDLGILTRQPF
jgi:hypothetical protein